MSRVDEVAKILGCTGSNVCYLLRGGRIKGTKTKAGWIVSDEAIHEYLTSPPPKPSKPPKHKLHKGQRFGYWTVLAPELTKTASGQWQVLCQCVCGNVRKVLLFSLLRGRSKSCGCRRTEKPSREQLEGRTKGQVLMRQIHDAGLAPRYLGKEANRNNRTGHIGVCWREPVHKFYAYIMVNRKQISLGLYEKLDDAIAARKAGEEKYFKSRQEKVEEIKRGTSK